MITRREILVKWQSPETISGRLTRYELLCNGESIYSGTDQEYRVTMLKSDTEYCMEVIVFTSEGRFRSRPAKARTLKDECLSHLSEVERQKAECLFLVDNGTHRHSLHETPTQVPARLKRTETVHFAHTAGTSHTFPKVSTRPGRAVRESKRPSTEVKSDFPSSDFTAESKCRHDHSPGVETEGKPRVRLESVKEVLLVFSQNTPLTIEPSPVRRKPV